MNADETPAELRARHLLHEPDRHQPNWETKVVCTCGERCTHWMDFYRHRGDSYRSAIDALLARLTAAEAENERHRRANLVRAVIQGADPEWIADVVSAEKFDLIPWRITDGLRARLTAAEADADRGWAWADDFVNLDHVLPDSFVRFQADGVLHDEALARRERPS